MQDNLRLSTMSNINPYLSFIDDGKDNRERENFQGFLFKEIDTRKRKHPISFQRSDFRGAAFRKSYFLRTNFGNADFIDTAIINTTFDDCSFRHTEMHNSFYESVVLKDSLFSSASIVKSLFSNCNLDGSKFNINTIRECKFDKCSITNSKFDRCSIDELEFSQTNLTDCDLSGNTAINIYFSNCRFKNVVIDGDYIGSYFFKGEFLDKLKMKYRGKVVNIDLEIIDILKNLFKIFFERSRYYEAINVLVQIGMLEGQPGKIFNPCKIALETLFRENNTLRRMYQTDKIFKLFEYYLNTGHIQLDDYVRFLNYCESVKTDQFGLEEQLFFVEKRTRLKSLLNMVTLELSMFTHVDPNNKILVEATIEERDKEKFLQLFDKVTKSFSNSYQVSKTSYEIIGYRQGSLIVTIVMYTVPAYLLMRLLRRMLNEARGIVKDASGLIADIRLEFGLHSALKDSKALKAYAHTNKTVREIQVSSIAAISPEKEQEMKEIKQLLPVLKSFVIYPNALTNSEK